MIMTEFTEERIAHDRNLANMASCLKWITENGEYSGSDWLVFTMDFGTGHDNKERHIYVTTDHVHGTEYSGAEDDVAYVMAAVNGYPDALDEIDSLRARIAELEEANRWHDYPKEKPDETGSYLCLILADGKKFVDVRYYHNGHGFVNVYGTIIAFQPLPSAPEAPHD